MTNLNALDGLLYIVIAMIAALIMIIILIIATVFLMNRKTAPPVMAATTTPTTPPRASWFKTTGRKIRSALSATLAGLLSGIRTLLSMVNDAFRPEPFQPKDNDNNPIEIAEGNLAVFQTLNLLGLIVPMIMILLCWIFSPKIGNFDLGNIDLTEIGIDGTLRIWGILFFAWPFIFLKLTLKEVKPHQIGAAYFFGFLLVNNLQPGPIFAFPGLVTLDLDSNQNRNYQLTAMSDDGLKRELKVDQEHLAEAMEHNRVFRFSEVTTATPQIADWKGMEAVRDKFEKNGKPIDPFHRSVVLTPSIMIILTITDYYQYRRNVRGEDSTQREQEVGRQLVGIGKSVVNKEFKKRTHGQLIWLMTQEILNEALREKITDMLDGFGKKKNDNDGNLGLKSLKSAITSLGATDRVHDAVNSVAEEEFKAQAEEKKGIGTKLRQTQEAEGAFALRKRAAEAEAEGLKRLIEVAEAKGVDVLELQRLNMQKAAVEFGKHTFLTNFGGGGSPNFASMEKEQIAALVALVVNELKPGSKTGS